MNGTETTERQMKAQWENILNTALSVIKDPVGFYRVMPKAGGFGDPLVFLVAMGAMVGVIQAVLGLFHIGVTLSVIGALGAIVVAPIVAVISGFIGAAILFVIWKLMGSGETYETAYRCGAYAAAIMPITAVLGIIPFVGVLVVMAWMLFLLVAASVEVHKIAAKTAWLVFGIITAILAMVSISSQLAARRVARMTPEEARKIADSYMKSMRMEQQAARLEAQAAEEQKKAESR